MKNKQKKIVTIINKDKINKQTIRFEKLCIKTKTHSTAFLTIAIMITLLTKQPMAGNLVSIFTSTTKTFSKYFPVA